MVYYFVYESRAEYICTQLALYKNLTEKRFHKFITKAFFGV